MAARMRRPAAISSASMRCRSSIPGPRAMTPSSSRARRRCANSGSASPDPIHIHISGSALVYDARRARRHDRMAGPWPRRHPRRAAHVSREPRALHLRALRRALCGRDRMLRRRPRAFGNPPAATPTRSRCAFSSRCASPAARRGYSPIRSAPTRSIGRPRASTVFTYHRPGNLLPGTGFKRRSGVADYTVYSKIRFPIADAPAFANSQSFMNWGNCEATGRNGAGMRGRVAAYRCRVNGQTTLISDESAADNYLLSLAR